jgi:hypothetical protein
MRQVIVLGTPNVGRVESIMYEFKKSKDPVLLIVEDGDFMMQAETLKQRNPIEYTGIEFRKATENEVNAAREQSVQTRVPVKAPLMGNGYEEFKLVQPQYGFTKKIKYRKPQQQANISEGKAKEKRKKEMKKKSQKANRKRK